MSAAKLIVGLAVTLVLPGMPGQPRRTAGAERVGCPTPRRSSRSIRPAGPFSTHWARSPNRRAGVSCTAPESAASRPLSIQATKKPAGEVLELVLEAGALRASFADGLLRVRPGTTTRESLDSGASGAADGGASAWCSANL